MEKMCRFFLPVVVTTLLLSCSPTPTFGLLQRLGQTLSSVQSCIPPQGKPLPENFTMPDFTVNSETINSLRAVFTQPPNPDTYKTVPELIAAYGYPMESHRITTKKGYILTFYRIPYGKSNGTNSTSSGSVRPPVLLQHGLLAFSGCWIATAERDNLAYNLADNGYDVWVSNIRGTIPSQDHTNPNMTAQKYWDYSWEDMGTDDIPSAIDYILNATSQPSLYYIGHSMGTTMFFSGMSLQPEYSQKVRLMIALAPVGYLYHATTALRLLGPAEAAYAAGSKVFNPVIPGQITPDMFNQMLTLYFGAFCTPEVFSELICSQVAFLIAGYDYRETNMTQLPVFLAHFPNPTSLKTLRHYGQSMLHDTFSRFDYGPVQNMKLYGQCTPPEYNISAISCPVALILSNNDALANEQDVAKLSHKFSNLVLNHTIAISHWNHLDYLVANDVYSAVIQPVLNIMKQH